MYRTTVLGITLATALAAHTQSDYCVPQVDVPNSNGTGISHVQLNSVPAIDNTSPVNDGYSLQSGSPSLVVGGYYQLMIHRSSGWTCPDNNLRAFIDFNGDLEFNGPTETVALLNSGGDGSETFNFVVPMSAVEGSTRLRIMVKQIASCGQVPINPCGTGDSLGYHGEVEDYTIEIAGHVGVYGSEAHGASARIVDHQLLLSLPSAALSGDRAEFFDATGRIMASIDLTGAGPGPHAFTLPAHVTGPVLFRCSACGLLRTNKFVVE